MTKATTNGALPLDVRLLHRRGALKPGSRSSWRWWRGSDPASGSSIACVCLSATSVLLLYKRGARGTAMESIQQPVKVQWTPCNYGGQRPWWTCPGCGKRVAMLYGAGQYFACRHCYNLCYTSQQENDGDRALRQAWKIWQRLGQEDGGHLEPPPPKPKWMRWRTYARLVSVCRDYETASWAPVRRMLARHERRVGKLSF